MKRIYLAWLAVAAVCASCAGPAIQTRSSAYSPTTRERLGQVVAQPFSDFGLGETDIPPVLAKIAAAPYAPPVIFDCPALRAETDAITQVLGPDIGSVKLDGERDIVSDGSAAAWGTARGAAEGWIPFHGVVRELSGAARHDRLVQQAILAGFVRRAYLRGLMQSRCP